MDLLLEGGEFTRAHGGGVVGQVFDDSSKYASAVGLGRGSVDSFESGVRASARVYALSNLCGERGL